MAYSKSGNKAVQQYIKKAYDQVSLRVPKGKRDKILQFAESRGKSLNSYIIGLVEEDMKKSGHPLEWPDLFILFCCGRYFLRVFRHALVRF